MRSHGAFFKITHYAPLRWNFDDPWRSFGSDFKRFANLWLPVKRRNSKTNNTPSFSFSWTWFPNSWRWLASRIVLICCFGVELFSWCQWRRVTFSRESSTRLVGFPGLEEDCILLVQLNSQSCSMIRDNSVGISFTRSRKKKHVFKFTSVVDQTRLYLFEPTRKTITMYISEWHVVWASEGTGWCFTSTHRSLENPPKGKVIRRI